jgi:membrane-associated HD superfamily phosphohydrolase
MESSSTRRGLIANPRDFIGGVGFLLLAIFVLWATRDLPGQRGFQLGAGSVPRLFAALLALNAIIVIVLSAVRRGPNVHYEMKPMLAIAALAAIGLLVNYIAGPALAVISLIISAFLALNKLTALGIRGPVFITVATLAFAAFIKPFGLFITVFALVAVSSAASKEYRPLESLLWALGLAVFSVLLFTLILNQPISAIPPSLLVR